MNAEPERPPIRHDDWREHAACHFEDPRLFTNPTADDLAADQALRAPDDPRRRYSLQKERERRIEAAKRVCRRCPVRWACLVDALEHGEPGVRGGYTEHERKQL